MPGQERYTTEVVLQNFRGELTMLDGRSGGGGGGGGGGEGSGFEPDDGPSSGGGGGSGGGGPSRGSRPPSSDLDDEIPF